jgi:hypothetical protein
VRIGVYAHETAGFLWIVVLAGVMLLERVRPARTDLIGQVLIWPLVTRARRGPIAGSESLGGEPV